MSSITFRNFKTKEVKTFSNVEVIHVHDYGETNELYSPEDALYLYKPGQSFSIWTKGNSSEKVLSNDWQPVGA